MSILSQTTDMVFNLLPIGGPGVCTIEVTNACNAACDFCNYARDKTFVQDKVWVDYDQLCQALDILYDRGVRYLTLVGGEPTMHPKLKEIVAYATQKQMRPCVVTNGSRLSPKLLEDLKTGGLMTLFISIDSPSVEKHEANRGLPGVCERVKEANQECKRLGIKTVASVTINKLIGDFRSMISALKELGFESVNFSYPRRDSGATSLSFSGTSSLINYTTEELIEAFETIKSLKGEFGILNPSESLTDMIRLLQNEEQIFPCYGGYKYFYLDCHLDVYRCNNWDTKMCSIFEFRDQPFIRDNCTKCMSDCYRDSSVLLHTAVSVGDAIGHIRQGQLLNAVKDLGKRTNLLSLKNLIDDWGTLQTLAKIEQTEEMKNGGSAGKEKEPATPSV